MSDVIVDASVAVKWFVPEAGSEEAERLLDGKTRLFAPQLVLGEVANALWKAVRRGDMSPEDGGETVDELPGYFSLLFETELLLGAALAMACSFDHPVYDCLYVESARRFDMPLLTSDLRLVRKFTGTAYARHIHSLSDWRP
ncbi:type II toxin-antitoxin system VapC family toxin [Xanthobacteraceae bacterium A53D]